MSVLDHLWQSTLVAGLAWCLTLLFRNNSAKVRHGLWLAASLKFLLPFSVLAALGRMAFVQTVPAAPMAVLTRMRPVAAPFSMPASASSPVLADHHTWLSILPALWLLGALAVAAVWTIQWLRLRRVVSEAKPVACDLAVPVRATPLLLEPGLVGIWRPVILLPESIAARLSAAEIDAVLNHELCHLRRRDNLLAALHMLVAAIFWFHPLVWFIGARLDEERERACDEDVLACGKNPLEYAQAILTVCRLYLRSPLPCAAGISGADLDQRITAIMAGDDIRQVDGLRKFLLASVAAVTILVPLVAGGLKSEPAARLAQTIASALTPAAPAIPVAVPAARPMPRVAVRQRKAAVAPVLQPPARVLAVPALEAVPVAVSAPKLEPMPQIVAEVAEANVCRPPQQLPGSRLMGPQVCLPRREWDRLAEQNLLLLPDGRTLVASYAKARQNVGPACIAAPSGASTSSAGLGGANCY